MRKGWRDPNEATTARCLLSTTVYRFSHEKLPLGFPPEQYILADFFVPIACVRACLCVLICCGAGRFTQYVRLFIPVVLKHGCLFGLTFCRCQAVEWAGGCLDIVVNNAGICVLEDFMDISSGTFDESIAINTRAPLLVSQVRGGSNEWQPNPNKSVLNIPSQ